VPHLSRATATELEHVLRYPKFQPSSDERHELLGEYLPWGEVVEITNPCAAALIANSESFIVFPRMAQLDRSPLCVPREHRDLPP
jgi:hypothetical protein